MLTLILLGGYSIFLGVILMFFIMAKLHAYKFKHFSKYLDKVTIAISIIFIILSILGYILIFSIKPGTTKTSTPSSATQEENY